jgi:ubiquinone/menaquinone biosynthesis C-methylase UbiE
MRLAWAICGGDNLMMAQADPSGFDTITGQPDYYIEFLDARTSIDDERRVKKVIIGLLQPHAGLSVLDVGSGTGDDARELAVLVAPGGSVVGVDRSSEMVAEARRRADGSGLPIKFVEGDAQALDFSDASFDRSRAERVLIHVPDPAAAVREMARVTRPGGLVVVSDLDGETIFLNSSNRQLTRDLVRGLTDDFASGWVGRRLPRYFIEAGLVDVHCVASVIQNSVAFMRMVFAGRLKMMVDAGQATSEDVADFWAELEQGEREGWLCSGVICFNVVGRKAE